MLKLEVLVSLKRDRAAVATLYDGSRKIRQDAAAATAVETLAAVHGNPQCDPLRPCGHPPLGTYRLLKRVPAPPGSEKEYGPELLVFEAEKGAALEAESFGRLGLLVYAGSSGADGGRRRTQGGVRLGKGMMQAILERLGPLGKLQLSIEAFDAPVPWWQFWKRRPPLQTAALSPDPPRFSKPPLDELTILAGLVTPRTPRQDLAIDDRDWRDRDRSSGSSSSSSGSEPYRGGGGGFSGAGASGSWGDAPSSGGRSPGVDSAGRILGAAAVAAAAVAATQAAAEGSQDSGSASSGATTDRSDTGSETVATASDSGDTGSETVASASDSSSADSGDSGTSTGTAY